MRKILSATAAVTVVAGLSGAAWADCGGHSLTAEQVLPKKPVQTAQTVAPTPPVATPSGGQPGG